MNFSKKIVSYILGVLLIVFFLVYQSIFSPPDIQFEGTNNQLVLSDLSLIHI